MTDNDSQPAGTLQGGQTIHQGRTGPGSDPTRGIVLAGIPRVAPSAAEAVGCRSASTTASSTLARQSHSKSTVLVTLPLCTSNKVTLNFCQTGLMGELAQGALNN